MRSFALALAIGLLVGPAGPAQEKKKVDVKPEEMARACAVTFAEAVNGLQFDNAVKWAAFPLETQQVVNGKVQAATFAKADALKAALKAEGKAGRFKLGTKDAEIPLTTWADARGGFEPKLRAKLDKAVGKTGWVIRFAGDKTSKPVEAVVVPDNGPMRMKIVYISWIEGPLA